MDDTMFLKAEYWPEERNGSVGDPRNITHQVMSLSHAFLMVAAWKRAYDDRLISVDLICRLVRQ